MSKIYDWFTTNILQANAKKTKAMVVSLQNITHIQIFSSTLRVVEWVALIRFLFVCVIINQH